MQNVKNLKIKIQHDDVSVEFDGNYEEVWMSVNKYLSELYPSISIVKKFLGTVDVSHILSLLSGKAQIVNGRIVISAQVEAKKKILLCLAAAYVGKALGLLENDALSPKEVSIATGLEERVTRARLSEMRKLGLVIKVDGGRYVFNTSAVNVLTEEV
ncbi:MAG: hypothetical protein RMJ14_02645 [Nitrososphaerota archaeon]|nr:hypothetical protein [Aigarchaeota archaeon]MDW8076522.1 hypothetical protein [Nitrososphaerota archaeon]